MEAVTKLPPSAPSDQAPTPSGNDLLPGEPDRFLLRLNREANGQVRVRASGPVGSREAVTELLPPAAWPDGTAGDGAHWARARQTGLALFAAAFPLAVHQLLEESRHRRDDVPLPITIELADDELRDLRWELLRDPDADRFLALSERSPLSRLAPTPPPIAPSIAPSGDNLRVLVVAATAVEPQPATEAPGRHRITTEIRVAGSPLPSRSLVVEARSGVPIAQIPVGPRSRS